ncbi:uncharacterized protein LOC5567456 isoform X6 [Aedes aegypti]|uniref:Uncharacterized protein n=1 Tax=Aedes aegypti TaxID=7159 RepID=A0A6I8TTF4_AEDAE|nr:uncharacterized protein LOC5567456 isoform X6 [Aedes aegypti]
MVVPKIAPAPIQPTKMAPPGPPRERRRKTHGLYFHSSPPKVLQMNNQNVQRDNDSRIKDGLVIKPSNIRIWLHQKHLAKLAKVIWAGQGMRLRTETSHHPKMKRFLECVPHVMGVIKDIHQAVVDNDLDTLKAKTASPTPRIVLTSKDANGLTPLHKAAGLAHTQIVEYILSIWPSLSSDEDHTGKTPLHWAASAKNNARSFNLLVQAGADETALDHRDKAAEYYKNRPNEIDRSLLTVIPEAPRISQQGFPACFDWTMFTLDEDTDDSNGSQTRMKPFLSQNNLLDNDVNNYNSVSKSKSVHNLTNGTLTDLPNDESESETKNKEGSTAEEQDEEPEANQQESTGGDAGDESEDVNGDENGDDGAEPTNGNDGNNEAEPAGEVLDVEENKTSEDTNQKTESESVEDNETTAATDQNQEATGDSQESENGPEKEEEGIINEANQQQEANQEQEGELNKAETDERDLSTENEVNEKELIESGKINGINGENEEDRDDEGNTENMVEEKDTVESKNVDDLKQNEETQGAGELTNDSLESNPSKENEDSEEIEQDSLNKPDEEVADTPLDGDFNKIVDNDNVSRMSATSRQSSAISQTGTGKVSRSTTATRDLSARTIQADENGYASDVKSRQSSAQSERITEAIINEVFSSRPESGLNGMNNGSSKNSAKSTMSRRESAKSISVASNKTKSAASKHDGNNNEFDEETNGNDAEPATSRPSTIASRTTNEHEQAEQSNSPRTQSSSTVRNVSATSVIERRPSAKSTTSQKSRTADDEEEGDSNDDSNQADVQIVHYKSGDEDGHDENDQSNEQPQSTAVNGNGYENGTQNDQNIKVAVEEPPVDSESTLRHLEASPKLTETDPDAGNATEEDEQQEKVESPSPAMEIKGTVEGEPDGGQLHSARPSGNLDSFNGQSIQETIDSGDMEQLAVIVLDGEGGKLLGRHSNQPEIQAFLDNVPSYMNKIRRVHVAAREGSIRDLQSALDRRKFATAKDSISPHGATPLHVATIFGHSGIIRYLAGRFPETTSATDNNGRTPLHYAATLKDNGHFYNLLNHLGANPKVEDNSNHSAEYYLDHEKAKDLLSHRQLLQDYGADEDLADSMFNDQELNDPQVEIPLFRTEEGRYLATSLGDPLIKGLTEVANKRPADPITYLATYLYNFANQNRTKTSASSQTITVPGKNDSNNNSIEGIIKEDSDKELEGSANTVEIAQIAQAVANIDAQAPQSPMAERVEEQMPPSPDSGESSPSMDNRDEHGQSMLHFACARSHGKNAIIQLIEESGTSITYRDELYRTARDVSLQATQPENAREIDRYVLGLAARGDLEALTAMLLDGYDHIVDVAGTDGTTIVQVASTRGHREVVRFLESIRLFEENREKLLSAIREKDLAKVKEITQQLDGAKLARTKNYYGRCSMHVAVLMESEEIVEYLATHFRATLKIGDNLERTPLHYAMGISNVEAISRILIKNGAKRVSKDLKGRQPSYYFMNKADILRLQEEERE